MKDLDTDNTVVHRALNSVASVGMWECVCVWGGGEENGSAYTCITRKISGGGEKEIEMCSKKY